MAKEFLKFGLSGEISPNLVTLLMSIELTRLTSF